MILNKLYTYEEIYETLKNLASTYDSFTVFRDIGESHDERPIPMLRIGLGIQTLILTSGMHGRENINPVILCELAEEYCRAYEDNSTVAGYSVREMLNKYSVVIIPLLNPDGYVITMCGYECVKNPILRQMCKIRGIDHRYWKYNARCVDINRNFPGKTYIQQQLGEYPSSENETQALIKVFSEYDTIGYLDFHSRGRVIYYYRPSMSFAYNKRNHKIARYMQKLSHYKLGRYDTDYLSTLNGGSSANYYSEFFQKPAITIETVEDDADYPLHPDYQLKTYQEIHVLPLEILNKT